MSKRRKESFSSSDGSNSDQSCSDNEKSKKKNPKKKKPLIFDDKASNLATELVRNGKKREKRRSAKEDPFEKQLRLAMEMSLKESVASNNTEDISKKSTTVKESSDSTEKKISQSTEEDLPDLNVKKSFENEADSNKELVTLKTTEPEISIADNQEILNTTESDMPIKQHVNQTLKEPETVLNDCIELISPQKDTNDKKLSNKKDVKRPKKSKYKSDSESDFKDEDDENEDEDFDVKLSKKKTASAKKKSTPAKMKKEQSSAEKRTTSNVSTEPDAVEDVLTPRRTKRSNSKNSANKNKSADKHSSIRTEDFKDNSIDQENIDHEVSIKKSLDMSENQTVLTEKNINKIVVNVPKSTTHDLLPKHVSKLPAKTDKFIPEFKNEEKSAVNSGFKALAVPARLTTSAPSSSSPLGRIEIKNNSPVVRVGLSRNKKIPSLHKNVKPF